MKSLISTRSLLWLSLVVIVCALLIGSIREIRTAQAADRESETISVPAPSILLLAADYDANTAIVPPANLQGHLPGAPTAVTIDVSYNGFTPAAQAAFQHGVDIWSTLVTSTVPISVTASWTPLASGVLGSAGARWVWRDFPGAPLNFVWYPDALADKLSGSDRSAGTFPDIIVYLNSDRGDWHYGTDGNPPPGTYDLATVVLHELGHGLGFFGSMRVDDGILITGTNPVECSNVSGDGCWGWGTGMPAIYDCFAADGDSLVDNNLIDVAVYDNPSAALGTVLQSGSVYFGGWNATHNAAGNPSPNHNIELHAPAVWRQGSSYSHLDEGIFPAGDQNSLMTPALAKAEAIHNPGPITLALFDDMGWDGLGSATACPSAPTVLTLKSMNVTGGFSSMGTVDELAPGGRGSDSRLAWPMVGLLLALTAAVARLISLRRSKPEW